MDNFTPEQIEQFLEQFFDVVGRRQYIGARYVPLFGRKGESSIDWDNTKPYEPLTIVLNQGNSFTSRTYVPAGIDINNTEYWAKTGNFNAQVEAYRAEVTALYGDWATFKDDMDTWKQDTIDDFEEAIDNIPDILPSDAFSSTNTVEDNIVGARKLLVLAIGDSYGQGYTPDGTVEGWCSRLGTRLTKIGYDYKSAYQGGASFGNGQFLSKLQTLVGTLTDNEKLACKMVLVAGGYNDRTRSTTEIHNGMQAFAAYVKANLPNSRVFVSFIGSCVTGLTTGDHQGATFAQCVETVPRYLLGATAAGFGFDGTGVGLLTRNAWFSSDYVHPNDTGLEIITDHLVESMNAVCYIPNRYKDCSTNNIIPDGEHIASADANYVIYFDRNYRGTPCNINIGTTNQWMMYTLSYSEAQSLSDSWTIAIGHVLSASFTGLVYKVPCQVIMRYNDGSGSKYVDGTGYIDINAEGTITLHFHKLNANGTGYMSITPNWMQVKTIGSFAI